MADLETRLRTEMSEAAGGVAYSRSLPPELARGVARRRAARVSVLSAVSVVTVVAVAVVSTAFLRGGLSRVDGPPAASSRLPAVSPLPSAPLAARTGAASAWTGREFVVWGGAHGNQAASGTFGDGATFDPATETWRLLPTAPITGRAGAVAVWTGSDLFVWGGRDKPSPTMPTDGALFNPTTRTWRRIADAPVGRTFARGSVVGGRVVIVGGGTVTGPPTSALVYDLAADRWHTIPTAPQVVDAVATNAEVVTLSVDLETRALTAAAIDPTRGTVRALPAPPLAAAPAQRVGIAWTGDHLIVAVTGNEATHVASLEAGDVWRTTSKPSADEFYPPVMIGFDPDTTPLAWTGSKILTASEHGVQLADPVTGKVTTLRRGDGPNPCGAGAAQAWTGTSLISWGGQSCRAGGSPEVATGAVITP